MIQSTLEHVNNGKGFCEALASTLRPERLETSQQIRAVAVLDQKIEYIHSPEFDRPDVDLTILASLPDSELSANRRPRAPTGTPPYVAALYAVPLLTRDQEYHLFRKMHYLKFRADVLRKQLDVDRPSGTLLDQIEQLLADALSKRNEIVRANLRLVVSIAKKLVDAANSFDDLVSDGNVPLIRAAEIFDFERGTRFSTYATWAIRNCLYRSIPRGRRLRSRYLSGSEPAFDALADHRSSVLARETRSRNVRSSVKNILSKLEGREKLIVMTRFGLGGSQRPHKFREIAEKLNISTERVRQLLRKSLTKLQTLVEGDNIDFEM